MSECKRNFEVNRVIFVLDCAWALDSYQVFALKAWIFDVDQKHKTINAALEPGYKFNTYSFKDYGRLIFDTYDEAESAANKFPKIQSVVRQEISHRFYKNTVLSINGDEIPLAMSTMKVFF